MADLKWSVETDRFECEGDDGRRYTVVINQNMIRSSHAQGSEDFPTTRSAILTDGTPVRVINYELGTFQISGKDQIIRRIDGD